MCYTDDRIICAGNDMTIKLDAITDDAYESRLHHTDDAVFAVLPGTHVETDTRMRMLVRIFWGVKASRIFGGLRAIQAELETFADQRFAVGERMIFAVPIRV